ncbi:nucleotidyltransferase family protein (plasmid) [Thioclava sp. 'Guangxiensis']|uniref:nucleotidyltransferase family protein n=1 Tax=Thioclava sp. 'Guangxiensis' TaxID=3149044 RepID=UPI0032C4498C
MITGLLLAAGASRRFGPEDKLLAEYRGMPLVLHMARALRQLTRDTIAVTSNERVADLLAPSGYRIIRIAAGQPQSESLKAGLAALGTPTRNILITLGDMPALTRKDLEWVAEGTAPACACAGSDDPIMPPVLIAPQDIAALREVTGDQGAGRLLRHRPDLRRVILPAAHLRDIDFLADLME